MKSQGLGNREPGTVRGDGVEDLLRRAVAPISDSDVTERDLWPAMRRRLNQETLPRRTAVPWFDWALAAGILVLLALSPDLIPVLLYHL
ncbi:MAG: hypothetical protein ACLGSD_00565 [Acidobacteriota bacterium]